MAALQLYDPERDAAYILCPPKCLTNLTFVLALLLSALTKLSLKGLCVTLTGAGVGAPHLCLLALGLSSASFLPGFCPLVLPSIHRGPCS